MAPTERHNTLALVQHMPPPRALPIVGASPSQLEYRVRQLAAEVERLTAELELVRAASPLAASNMPLVVDPTSGSLMQRRYLYPVDAGSGHLKVPAHLTRFSLDVGFNEGLVLVDDWLQFRPDTFAIGIEANPYLHALFELITTEKPWPRGFEGHYWTPTNHSAVARARAFRAASSRGQVLLVHAAVTTSAKRAMPFNLGFGWFDDGRLVPDVGSLFDFSDKAKREVQQSKTVATLRLDDILAHVPPPPTLIWDTLKIDVQGADIEALESAGRYLERFHCVIGEFRAKHYKIPFVSGGHQALAADLLTRTGFVMAHHTSHNQLWLNRRHREAFADPKRNFTCAMRSFDRASSQRVPPDYYFQRWIKSSFFPRTAQLMLEQSEACRANSRNCAIGVAESERSGGPNSVSTQLVGGTSPSTPGARSA